jgi:hypothetical protein
MTELSPAAMAQKPGLGTSERYLIRTPPAGQLADRSIIFRV